MTVLRRAWIPLVVVAIVAVSAFTVARVRTFFGAPDPTFVSNQPAEEAEPFNPKVVTYEVSGPLGSVVDINYVDLDSAPQQALGVSLPWSLTLQTTAPSAMPKIVAQGDADTLTCRIIVDDEVKDEKTATGVSAQTFCLVKSA
ncbi:MAG: MmpS family transport accessory protein [Mycobacterium sp.]